MQLPRHGVRPQERWICPDANTMSTSPKPTAAASGKDCPSCSEVSNCPIAWNAATRMNTSSVRLKPSEHRRLTTKTDGRDTGHPVRGRVVIDRGAEIPAEELPRVLSGFLRASTGRHAEGLGLRLEIARLIVEAHGGRIWVESLVGEGSTFGFSLPVA